MSNNESSGAEHLDQPAALADLAARCPVVVCCGPGGVGKTTVSACIALEAARQGRRACVVTVDPARRLADALGVDTLSNEPSPVAGTFSGSLDALMLDSKGTFDDLVHRYATTPEQAEAIQSNRLYQNLVNALSGTQEYMAMEKLYELTQDERYDLVVVDTPPTRNALDLLDAPRRLTRFLENRFFRALLLPTRASLRAISVATQALLRTVSKVAGADLVNDAVGFFQAFQGMEEGFRTRATAVRELLADPSTAYVLVTSPRPAAVDEAAFFAEKLEATGVSPSGLVVNRVHPSFGGSSGGMIPAPSGSALADLVANLDRLEDVATREHATFSQLVDRVAPAPVGRIPLLGSDVHDLDGLTAVADHLFGAPSGVQ